MLDMGKLRGSKSIVSRNRRMSDEDTVRRGCEARGGGD